MNQEDREMGLTVKEFFRKYSWQGEAANQRESIVIDSTRWLTLNVGKFFEKNNWTGKPPTRSDSIEGEVAPLMLSVKQFFQRITWEGSISPSKSTGKQERQQKSEWKVSDLSNLF